MSKEEKKKPKYNMWQNVCYMLRMACKAHAVSVIVLCVLVSVLQLASNITKMLISPVILSYVEKASPLNELFAVIIGFAVMQMAWSGFLSYADSCKMAGRITVRNRIIGDIFWKTCTTSYPNLWNRDIVKLKEKAYKVTSGNNEATEDIWNTLTGILLNIGGFVLYLLMLTAVEPIVILITILTTIASYVVNRYGKQWRYKHRDEVAEYDNITWYVLACTGESKLAKDMRIFGMQDWLREVYDNAMRAYKGYFARREKTLWLVDLANAVLAFLRNGIAYIYLIHMTVEENLLASQFLLYFAAVGGFTKWISGILDKFAKLYEQSLDISMLREYLETPEPFLMEEGEHIAPDSYSSYKLELKNVSFRYPEAEEDTIHQMNLTIEPGEKLAIVGLNGAGKTTLVKLLCGFYNPTEGQVLLNGTDIRRYNRQEYYALFSAVFQRFSVLEVTLAENVAQAEKDIDMERVKQCIEKAGLTERLEELPKKYDTHIGKFVFEDGVELSGGEMQRLMLARALYKDAPIIILDEPTAALDPLAENDIYQKYNAMMGERTSVYISHRLASTRFCDRVIYLKNGSITEEGTHEELLAAGGEYAELFEVQRKYYREEKSDGTEK